MRNLGPAILIMATALPSEAENKRLMFALDFLRTSCELKSDTGF